MVPLHVGGIRRTPLSHSPGRFAVSVFIPLHPQPASLLPKPFMFGTQVPPSSPPLPAPELPPLLPPELPLLPPLLPPELPLLPPLLAPELPPLDRKSTRLNSSHTV